MRRHNIGPRARYKAPCTTRPRRRARRRSRPRPRPSSTAPRGRARWCHACSRRRTFRRLSRLGLVAGFVRIVWLVRARPCLTVPARACPCCRVPSAVGVK
eukprot:4060158-Prymnesium_polylepis.1